MAINLSESGTKVFTSFNSPFTNTENLVIEYNDILRPLGFDVLRVLRESDVINQFINIEPIQNISTDELYEWYVNREEANVFANFELNDNYFKDIEDRYEWLEDFLYKEIDELKVLDYAINYSLLETIPTISNFDIIKKVFIYTERYSESIERDIKENFGSKAKYIYGDFGEVLKENNIKDNTTYILSDIVKIEILRENDLLKFSSILLADNFGYNYDEDDEILIDVEELVTDNIFKIFYFPSELSDNAEDIFDLDYE
jgi:hypothetical protein|nr:MAG TPA: hypothetical protein [Caudoviricetes sp.]